MVILLFVLEQSPVFYSNCQLALYFDLFDNATSATTTAMCWNAVSNYSATGSRCMFLFIAKNRKEKNQDWLCFAYHVLYTTPHCSYVCAESTQSSTKNEYYCPMDNQNFRNTENSANQWFYYLYMYTAMYIIYSAILKGIPPCYYYFSVNLARWLLTCTAQHDLFVFSLAVQSHNCRCFCYSLEHLH